MRERYSVQKTLDKDALQTWVQKPASWYINDPFLLCQIWHMIGLIKFSQIKAKLWLKFKKTWKTIR